MSVHVVANDDSELEVTVDGVQVPAICELSVHWLRQQMHVLRASIKGAGNSNGRRGECRHPQKMLAVMCVTGSVTFTNAAARPTFPSPLKSHASMDAAEPACWQAWPRRFIFGLLNLSML